MLKLRCRIAAEPFAASKGLLVDGDVADLKDLGEHLVTILAEQGWDDEQKLFNDDLTLEKARNLLEKLEMLAAALGGFHAVQADADVQILSDCLSAIDSAMTKLSQSQPAEFQNDLVQILKKHAANLKDYFFCNHVLSQHGWTDTGFPGDVDQNIIILLQDNFINALYELLAKKNLQRIIDSMTSRRTPMPLPDMNTLPVLHTFKHMVVRTGLLNSEDEAKAARIEAEKAAAHIHRLVQIAGKGATEALNNVTAYGHKIKAELEKKIKDAESQNKREAKARAKQMLADEKKTGAGAARKTVHLLDLQHDVFEEWPFYDDATSFAAARASHDFEKGLPLIIKDHTDLGAMCEDRSLKSAISVFGIQYPTTKQAQETKRGQTPFTEEKHKRVRELMLQVAPAPAKVTVTSQTQIAVKASEMVSFFGYSPAMQYQGVEKFCLPTLRYTCRGTREICILQYTDIMEYAAKQGMDYQVGQDMLAYMTSIVDTLCSEDNLTVYKQCGGKIWRTSAGPGSLTFQPFGCWMVERTLGDANVIGIRTATLDSTSSSLRNFIQFRKAFIASLGDKAGDNAVVTFWKKLEQLMKEYFDKAN